MSDPTVPAYRTLTFWAAFVLTNVGLLFASGLVLPSVVAQVIGWIVTVLGALGFKGWTPPPAPPAA